MDYKRKREIEEEERYRAKIRQELEEKEERNRKRRRERVVIKAREAEQAEERRNAYIRRNEEYYRTHELLTGKRLLHTALICLFVGFLGGHSFYNKNYAKGIFQLFISLITLSNYFIGGFLWAGYDLFLMCFKRYYIPIPKDRSNKKMRQEESVIEQKEKEKINDIKLEIGDKSKEGYLWLTIIGTPLGLQYMYARYWRRAYYMLICLPIICLAILILSYLCGSTNIGGSLVVIIYTYVLISSLNERIDANGKLFKPTDTLVTEGLIVFFVLFLWLFALLGIVGNDVGTEENSVVEQTLSTEEISHE